MSEFVAMTTYHDMVLVLKSDGSVYKLVISDELGTPHEIRYTLLCCVNPDI